MKITRLVFLIAAVIIGVWLLGLVFRIAAWLIDGLLYIAAIVVIIGLISTYMESRRKKPKSIDKSNVIDVDEKP